MTKALIAFGSTTGNTAEVANWVFETLEKNGVEVTLEDCAASSPNGLCDPYDLIVFGCPTYGDDEIEIQEDFEPILDELEKCGVNWQEGRRLRMRGQLLLPFLRRRRRHRGTGQQVWRGPGRQIAQDRRSAPRPRRRDPCLVRRAGSKRPEPLPTASAPNPPARMPSYPPEFTLTLRNTSLSIAVTEVALVSGLHAGSNTDHAHQTLAFSGIVTPPRPDTETDLWDLPGSLGWSSHRDILRLAGRHA